MVTSSPASNTICAASGSAQMLNSAAGGHVALGDRAAHEDDAIDPRGAVRPQVRGDVRERPCRHERDRRRRSSDRVGDPERPRPSRPARGSAVGQRRRRRGRSLRGRALRRRARATSGSAAPAATGMSARPASSSTRRAFAVVFASVWFPYVVVTPSSSTSELAEREQQRDGVVVAGIAVEDDRVGIVLSGEIYLSTGPPCGTHGTATSPTDGIAAEDRVDLRCRRQRRLCPEPRGGERAGRTGTCQRLRLRASFEQRDGRRR